MFKDSFTYATPNGADHDITIEVDDVFEDSEPMVVLTQNGDEQVILPLSLLQHIAATTFSNNVVEMKEVSMG